MFLLDSDIATLVYSGSNEKVMAYYDAARPLVVRHPCSVG